jgi:CRP-like cAMP-binding protein
MRRREIRRFTVAFPTLANTLQYAGVRRLLLASRRVRLEPGTTLIRAGKLTGDLHLVVDGSVRMSTEVDQAAALWTIGAGGSVGTAGFVNPGVAELTAVAVTLGTALRLRHDQLVALAAAEPRLVEVLLDHLATELLRDRNRLAGLFAELSTENHA